MLDNNLGYFSIRYSNERLRNCGNDLWDGTGEIVFDVYKVKDIENNLKLYPDNNCFEANFSADKGYFENDIYFWRCNNCGAIHVWTDEKYSYRRYMPVKESINYNINEILKMEELLIININESGDIYDVPFTELIKCNPLRPEKYYISDDLSKVYIYNTDKKDIDMIYDLKEENFAEYEVEDKIEGNKVIYNVKKVNDGHNYIVVNGKRILNDNNNHSHKEVHTMKHLENNEGVWYEDPNSTPKIYDIDD